MTDLNLKAIRIKQVIAMFMAVCLTVLSVNVDVFAAAQSKNEADYYFGNKGGDYELTFSITQLNGMPITTDPNGEKAGYTGDVEVSVEYAAGATRIFEVSSNNLVSAVNGELVKQTIIVKTQANTKTEEIFSDATLVFTPVDDNPVIDGKRIEFTSDIIVGQEAAPVKSTVSADDDLDDVYKATSYNGDPTDKASPFDGVSVEIADADFVSENYVNSLEVVSAVDGKLKEGVKTVTIYDGVSKATLVSYNALGKKQKLATGAEVAYASTADATLANVSKSSRIKALEQAYVQGQEFVGYTVYAKSYADATANKPKKPVYSYVGLYDFNDIPTDGAAGVIAVATYDDAKAVYTNLNASVVMPIKKTVKVQMDLNSATVSEDFVNTKNKYRAVLTEVKPYNPSNSNKITYKKVIKSVAVDAKKGVVTLKSGNVSTLNGSALNDFGSYITFEKQVKVKNENGKLVNKWVAVNAKLDVAVFDPAKEEDKVPAIEYVSLAGLYGESYANLDVSSKAKQTVKVVGTTMPYMTDVKYVATSRELGKVATAADLKSFLKTKENGVKGQAANVTVNANGEIKAKKAGTAYVYAYTTLSDKKTIIVSNVFTVNVTKSSAKFTVAKDTKIKYNNARKAADKTAYVGRNDKVVKYEVKGVAKDATDFVAVRVLNKDGKVVLGALTKATKTSRGKTTVVPNKYQITLKAGKIFTADNNLVIVGQAPNGMMKGAKLTFAAR